jgi:hypothetical protein
MTKKVDDFYSNWSTVIASLKFKETLYYHVSDVEHKQPYRYLGEYVDFDTKKKYVSFVPLKVENPTNYVLDFEKFLKEFVGIETES